MPYARERVAFQVLAAGTSYNNVVPANTKWIVRQVVLLNQSAFASLVMSSRILSASGGAFRDSLFRGVVPADSTLIIPVNSVAYAGESVQYATAAADTALLRIAVNATVIPL